MKQTYDPTAPMTYFEDPASVVFIGGTSALDFLQRLTTQKLANLALGRGRSTVLCDEAGRVIDLLATYRSAEGLICITTGFDAAPVLVEHLSKFILYGDKVTVTDASQQVRLIRIRPHFSEDEPEDGLKWTSENQAALLQSLQESEPADDRSSLSNEGQVSSGISGHEPPTKKLSEIQSSNHTNKPAEKNDPDPSWLEGTLDGQPIWFLPQLEPGGLGGLDLVVPRGLASRNLLGHIQSRGWRKGDESEYTEWRIGAGAPAWGAEIDGKANPLELLLWEAIDWDKGCYVGQEVVARLANYEKIQRRLVRIHSASTLDSSDQLLVPDTPSSSNTRLRPGQITSLCHKEIVEENQSQDGSSNPLRSIGLALIPRALPARQELVAKQAGRIPQEQKPQRSAEQLKEGGEDQSLSAVPKVSQRPIIRSERLARDPE